MNDNEFFSNELASRDDDLITPQPPETIGMELQLFLNELVKQFAKVPAQDQEQAMADFGLSGDQMYDIMNAIDERNA